MSLFIKSGGIDWQKLRQFKEYRMFCVAVIIYKAPRMFCANQENTFYEEFILWKKGRSIAFSKAIVSKQMVNERLKQLELAFKRQMFQVLVDFSCHIICWKMTSSDITQLYAHKVLFFQFQQLNCNYETLKYYFISNYYLFHGIFKKSEPFLQIHVKLYIILLEKCSILQ